MKKDTLLLVFLTVVTFVVVVGVALVVLDKAKIRVFNETLPVGVHESSIPYVYEDDDGYLYCNAKDCDKVKINMTSTG